MTFFNSWSSSTAAPANTTTTRTAYAGAKRRGKDTRLATAYATTTRRPYINSPSVQSLPEPVVVEMPSREYLVVDRPVYTPVFSRPSRYSTSSYARPIDYRKVEPVSRGETFVFCLIVLGMFGLL